MRPVNSSRPKKRLSNSLDAREERRRKLLLQRQKEQLLNLWRLLIFMAITFGLGFIMLKKGWSPINADQITIKGSPKLQADAVVAASGIQFPQPLLGINPLHLEETLLRELPLKAVAIRRRLIPPSLEVDVQEREPIAYAMRRSQLGQERGMLDKDGHWMSLKIANKTQPPTKDLYVDGWMASHRKWIARIISQRDQLGTSLERIIINPNGELSLKTKDFELVYLGGNASQLDQQLRALKQLSISLPSDFRNRAGTTIDITDPSKPELQMTKPSR